MVTKVAVLGTGLMGFPMARNIARSGYAVSVWNRSRDKAAPLAADAVAVADTAQEAVTQADFVISMLSDGQAVAAVAAPLALAKGAMWIDMSSTQPGEARRLAEQLAATGNRFLDAPVSGGSRGAEAGTLAIMVGGDARDFEAAEKLLAAMGRPTLVGPTGAGQLAKLANQAIVGVTIAAVAEATLLLERGGADAAAVRRALSGGFADSTILQQHGQRMSARDFVPGGLSRLQVKDLDNVLAEGADLDLPIVTHVRDRFAHYVNEMGGGDRDHAGLFEELLSRNPPTQD